MWPFKQKQKRKPELLMIEVPAEKRRKFCELYDKWQKDGDKTSRLDFWEFVVGILPERKQNTTWSVTLNWDRWSTPRIQLTIDKDETETQ
jgi:hypothetical protein